MVLYPEDAFASAVKGLTIWWNIVFPALLPFFIGSEILMGLGVVHFLGVLLEPLMRPLFNVPGVGSFVLAMGLASGFPIGAILTARLRREELVSKVEGERLMCFTNTADPLFMTGAVAVGMLGRPDVAFVISAAHYLSSITTGFFLRFYGKNRPATREKQSYGSILGRALQALAAARQKDGRPIGQLMGDAIRNSINSLLLVGGFIILFSVLIRILTIAGVIGLLGRGLMAILGPLGLDSSLVPALISGIFEIDLGCELAGQAAAVPLMQKVMVVGSIIAWSGLSVYAQVASIISDTDLSPVPYFFARLLHATLAALYTWLLMGPLAVITAVLPAFARLQQAGGMVHFARIFFMSRLFLLSSAALLIVGIALHLYHGFKIAVFRR
jgi:sporulation integral membrane protein YlbJ